MTVYRRHNKVRSVRFWRAACAFTLCGIASVTHAQGILTVTPARTVQTAAGNGTAAYTGDGSAATAASLASPGAVAYDSAGNLYIADTRNHAIRRVALNGTITTVAGIGASGFSGDGAAATAAELDSPGGVAVDTSGNLYIADTRNNRIRKVSPAGTITTIAGTGSAGFSGDGAAATAATLAQPSGLALDSFGNLYIADTNNERIRKITGGNILTIAGNGVQGFSGDGGLATAAALSSPTGVAVDAGGNVYIADRHNQRVRLVTTSTGNISTLAGSGAISFAGGYAGEGVSATAALLAKPTTVAVDSAGSVYVADINNQRIREIAGGAIATVAGNGVQGFSGDGSAAVSASLDTPGGVAADAAGNIAIAARGSQRVRKAPLGVLAFGSQTVGSRSSAQTVILENTGTAPITITGFNFTGSFVLGEDTACGLPAPTLDPGDACGVDVQFAPAANGSATGTVSFSGAGVVTQAVALTGTGVPAGPAAKLAYTAAPATPISAGGNAGAVQAAVEDAAGNIITTDSTTVISLDVTGQNSYHASYTATAASGIATFSLASTPLNSSGTYTYTASSGALTQATATEVVSAGTLAGFSVSGLGTFSAPQTSGTATVKAVDAFGNVVASFTGVVVLTTTDPSSTVSPASYTYAAGDAGVHTFAVTFRTAGTQTVTATSAQTVGSQTGIIVRDAVWVLNTTGSLARLTDTGAQTTTAGATGSASTAGAIAFDSAGVVWVTQASSNGYARYAADGTLLSSSNGVGLQSPTAVFIDGAGQAWFANSGNGSVSALSNSGAAISPSGYQPGKLSSPSGLIVDSSGSVWVTNAGANSVTRIIGAAAPAVTPTVTGTTNNTQGTRP